MFKQTKIVSYKIYLLLRPFAEEEVIDYKPYWFNPPSALLQAANTPDIIPTLNRLLEHVDNDVGGLWIEPQPSNTLEYVLEALRHAERQLNDGAGSHQNTEWGMIRDAMTNLEEEIIRTP